MYEDNFLKKFQRSSSAKKDGKKNDGGFQTRLLYFFVKRKHHVGFIRTKITQTKILVFDLKKHPHKFL